MTKVDVLVVTALKSEHDAARAVGLGGCAGNPGIPEWRPMRPAGSRPYLLGDYETADGERFRMALARATRTGPDAIHDVALTLVRELEPTCLAMCGVCAGHPEKTALGDVVFAETAYAYSEGRTTQDGLEPGPRQSRLIKL